MVTVAGTFTQRADKNLLQHSGFICIDIDNVGDLSDLKSQVYTDDYVYAGFDSVSGYGLCLIFVIKPKKHREAFAGICQYLLDKYGIVCDPTSVNESRARFVSYDPGLHYNPNAKLFDIYPQKQVPLSKIPKVIFAQNDFENIITQLQQRGVDIVVNYQEWLRVGFGLADKFGESGRTYFHQISSIGAKYNPSICDKQYTACIKAGKTGVTIASLYYYAKAAGVETVSKETRVISQTAQINKKGDRTKEDARAALQKDGINSTNADSIINQVFDQNVNSFLDDSLISKLELYLRQSYNLRRNEITRKIEIDGKFLDDKLFNDIWCDATKIFEKVTSEMLQRLINSSFTKDYNPFLDFFEKHSSRNPSGTIDALFDSIACADYQFARKFGKKWLVSIIASIHGQHSPLMIVLAGTLQGTGKCLGKGTRVLMFDGTIKNVEDVVIGDKLMGLNGASRTVLSLAHGTEQMYWIRQNKGIDYRVNESHILSLKNRDNHNTLNISVKDIFDKKGYSRYVGYRTQIENDIDKDLPVNPYFLGLWLGDGCSRLKSGLKIETEDNEIIEYLSSFTAENGYHLSKYEQKKSNSDSYGIVQGKGSGTGKKYDVDSFKNKFRALNLDRNKHIPSIYKFSSRKQRLQLLAGLIDADGSIASECNYEITQKNKTLAEDICFVCRSLGFRATMKAKVINLVPYWRITIGGNMSEIPVKISRKKIENTGFYNVLYTGIKIEKDIVDEYYGFEIDGDKLFCLEDFTVTHNTEFFRRLLPSELKDYYAESKLDAGKDDEILMTQKLLIMDDEMGGKSKKDEMKLKEMLSRQTFSLREPYGRANVDLNRLAVLCGTTNNEDILSDPTGNRRLIPIAVYNINHESYNAVDKIDVLMEAYHLYKSGFNWEMTREDIAELNSATARFEKYSSEYELCLQHFKIPDKGDVECFMTATEIKNYLETHSVQKLSLDRLGKELTRIGFEQKHKKIAKTTKRVYILSKVDTDIHQLTA
jgi:hypothetical protein